MSQRVTKRQKLRKISIGDMNKPVAIRLATLTAPVVDGAAGREYEDTVPVWFCKMRSVTGMTIFGATNIEEVVTHIFEGRYVPDITIDHVLVYKNKRFRILQIEDVDERQEYSVFTCTERGKVDEPLVALA